MPTILKSISFTLAMVFAIAPSAMAADDKAKIKKDFDTWHQETKQQFEKNWAAIQEAEAAARPTYDKGVKIAEAGKNKKAIETLLDARAKLFNHKKATFVHVDKGLSHQIALALASLYSDMDDEARLKREIVFMDKGRDWLPKEEEQKIFLHHALKELYRVWGVEEAKEGRKRMKTKDRNRLKRIMAAVTVGPHTDILFEDLYEMRKGWEAAFDASKKTYAQTEFDDFGGQGDLSAHDDLFAPTESNFREGLEMLVINREVTKATKKTVTFDFTTSRVLPVNCKSTGKILEVTPRGRYIYKQKCEFMAREGGHKLVMKAPKGIKLKKGDVVTMYVTVAKTPTKGKIVQMDGPAIVHSSRKGKTQVLLGVKTKKPAYIVADGDYRVVIKDDAQTPPKVK